MNDEIIFLKIIIIFIWIIEILFYKRLSFALEEIRKLKEIIKNE